MYKEGAGNVLLWLTKRTLQLTNTLFIVCWSCISYVSCLEVTI